MLGSLISAGASLLGGLFGSKSQSKANEANIRLQKDLARKGIQWRVEDANKAGIHPLYALGTPTATPGPLAVGDTSLGQGIANAGQDIGRAVSAYGTKADRKAQSALAALQIERAGLENQLLASQIRLTNQAGNPPAFPARVSDASPVVHAIPGQGDAVIASPSSLPVSGPVNTPLGTMGSIDYPRNLPTASDLQNQWGEFMGDVVPIVAKVVQELGEARQYLADHNIRNTPSGRVAADKLYRKGTVKRYGPRGSKLYWE